MAKVGVLALQGDFEAHQKALERAGAEVVPVRSAAELASVDGLVIPGGESTTMLNLLRRTGLFEPLQRFGQEKPIFGTCAGAILLATEVTHPQQESLGLVDMQVERNAYGRQLESRIVPVQPEHSSGLPDEPVEAVFIRAPIIRRVGNDVKVLAKYQENPVLVESGKHLIATFHPELSDSTKVHERFLSKLNQ